MSVEKLKIGIVVGSVRKGRNADAVSHWMYNFATKRNDAEYELVDLINYKLPLLGQEIPSE
ncbi:MAG: NAD(P)H-dependent oxidoreductase, partial [Psychrobacillus sp.]